MSESPFGEEVWAGDGPPAPVEAPPAQPAAPLPAPPDHAPPPPRPRTRVWLPLLLAAAVVAAAVEVGLLGTQLAGDRAREASAREGLRAARAAAPVLLSYDYRHLAQDFARGLALTTGRFRAEYRTTTASVVGPPALQYRAVVQASVLEAGVVSARRGVAVVLLFVDQTTTSTRVTGQKLDLNRVRFTLVDVHGHWLVTKVDAL